jgi:hypothetical protein
MVKTIGEKQKKKENVPARARQAARNGLPLPNMPSTGGKVAPAAYAIEEKKLMKKPAAARKKMKKRSACIKRPSRKVEWRKVEFVTREPG